MSDGRSKAPFVRLGDLLVDSCYGTSEPNTADGTTPVLGIPHVRGGRVRLTDLPRTQLPDAECAKLALRSGDLLPTRTNSHELVGQTGLVEVDTDAIFVSAAAQPPAHSVSLGDLCVAGRGGTLSKAISPPRDRAAASSTANCTRPTARWLRESSAGPTQRWTSRPRAERS